VALQLYQRRLFTIVSYFRTTSPALSSKRQQPKQIVIQRDSLSHPIARIRTKHPSRTVWFRYDRTVISGVEACKHFKSAAEKLHQLTDGRRNGPMEPHTQGAVDPSSDGRTSGRR